MPYIDRLSRPHLEHAHELTMHLSAGELNFVVTKIIDRWLGKHPNYSRINTAIGVLECAKLELYRRVAAPYEDQKIRENGDVYTTRGGDE